MGGTVALLFAAMEPGVAALVTVAAPVHPENFPRRILTAAQLQNWRNQGFTIYNGQRLNLSLLEDLQRLNVPQAARSVQCPVLILHGDADEIVPVKESYELHDSLSGTRRLSILHGTDHRLSDPALMQRALEEALDWLVRHVH
jgi:dipeptidyl aminopeptidase/acylaminoacyl peptidase